MTAPLIEPLEPAALVSLASQVPVAAWIGWHGRLPVTRETFDRWHQRRFPGAVPELWCSHIESGGGVTTAWLWIDPLLPVFAGHFPGNPILPGIVQIEWARRAAERLFPGLQSAGFSGLTHVKFKSPVLPSSWLQLRLSADADGIAVTGETAGRVCTQSRLLYGASSRPVFGPGQTSQAGPTGPVGQKTEDKTDNA